MINKASYAARSLSRVSSRSQVQVRRTLFGWFEASSQQSPMTAKIEDTLERAFQPSFLKVLDESDKFYTPRNAGTHYKVIIVSNEFDYIKSDWGRRELVNGVLAEQLRGPSHSHQVQAVHVNTLAMTPAEHVRIMSKYDTPNQWIAMVLESIYDESPTNQWTTMVLESSSDESPTRVDL